MSTPRLTPAIVMDEAQLGTAVDAVIQADETDRDHREEILKLQAELRRHLDDEGWGVLLRLDAAIGARLADLSLVIAVWAFVEGQRDAGGGGDR